MTTFKERRGVHQLELQPLAEGAWRLCDRSLDDDDAASVVAYVEEKPEGIEVIWLTVRTGRQHFDQLDEVVAAAAAVLASARRSRSRRPVEIPHLAPKPRSR